MIELDVNQKKALKSLTDGVKLGKSQQTLGGYAGTGKTTLMQYLLEEFPKFAVCAYTGKAANVLRKKNVAIASTIHSLIYQPVIMDGHVYFELKPDLPHNGIAVDEGSMVSKELYEDLKSFGLPLVFFGDHGQLEPIGSDFNLMRNPDYRLEDIHRYAGDIAKFAQHLRKGLAARGFRGATGEIKLIAKNMVNDDRLAQVDQVICAYNKTRVDINKRIRAIMGYQGKLVVGERVMCLRNNKQLGLFNGMQGIVRRLHVKKKKHLMDFEFDGMLYPDIWYDPTTFGTEKADFDWGRDSPNPFDYAYCITAHKSQGDEWGKILVLEQKCQKWDHRRWAYTAASRAREELTWVLA
jgi:exodeoxyribonuclease-5